MKTSKYKVLIITLIALVGIGVYTILNARADSLTASLKVSPGCVSSINGATSQTINVVAGNTTLFVSNGDSIVGHVVSGPGVPAGTKVDRASRETNNETTISLDNVTVPTTITFTPIPTDYTNPGIADNNCPLGSAPSSSYLVINPVAAPAPVTSAPAASTKKQTNTNTATAPASPTPDTKTDSTSNASSPKKAASILKEEYAIEETASPYRRNLLVLVVVALLSVIGFGLAYFIKTNPKNSFSRKIKQLLGRR